MTITINYIHHTHTAIGHVNIISKTYQCQHLIYLLIRLCLCVTLWPEACGKNSEHAMIDVTCVLAVMTGRVKFRSIVWCPGTQLGEASVIYIAPKGDVWHIHQNCRVSHAMRPLQGRRPCKVYARKASESDDLTDDSGERPPFLTWIPTSVPTSSATSTLT